MGIFITRILVAGMLATFLFVGLGAPAYADGKIKAKFNTLTVGQSIKAPRTVIFVNESKGTIESYLWDFGDGTTSTEEAPTHVYETPGDYTVTLTVKGPAGESTKTHVISAKVGK